MPHTITRFGTVVPADEVFFAWTSGSLERMLAATSLQSNEVDRHHLLQCTVQRLYRQRADRAKCELLFEVAMLHLGEMKVLMDGLRRHDVASKARSHRLSEEESQRTGVPAPHIEAVPGGAIPVIETFLLVVRALCENDRYEDAKKVWHRAKEVGYLSSEGLAMEEEAVDRRQRRNEARSKRVASKL
jgi:pentatricopeptide repeat protein